MEKERKIMSLEQIENLPPITEEDRIFKTLSDVQGSCIDLGEDIELKQKLAKKFHWKKAKKPLIRVLIRSGDIFLYKDYFYHCMIDIEQYKDYNL